MYEGDFDLGQTIFVSEEKKENRIFKNGIHFSISQKNVGGAIN